MHLTDSIPVIVAGDFNATPDSPIFKLLADAGVTSDDNATPDNASDRMIATVLMRPLPWVLL